ncbi:hypothetical protein VTO73DRAFT_6900 [Trametes versicolor]
MGPPLQSRSPSPETLLGSHSVNTLRPGNI